MAEVKTFVYLGSDETTNPDFLNVNDMSEVLEFNSHWGIVNEMIVVYETDTHFVGIRDYGGKVEMISKEEVSFTKRKNESLKGVGAKTYAYEASCCNDCEVYRNIDDFRDEINVVSELSESSIIMLEGTNGSFCLLSAGEKSFVVPTSSVVVEGHRCCYSEELEE